MRLRLFLLSGLSVLAACGGCMSVDIETRADRAGGGARDYVVTLDPSLAKTYESARGAGKVFRLPGDDLLDKPGIALVARSQDKDSSGAMSVRKTFRAGRLSDAGTATDSISYTIARSGAGVTYRYREHYLASDIDSGTVTASYGERYRFRHVLHLPGTVTATNADSARAGEAIWSRTMRQVRAEGLVMTAESREIDPLAWAVLILIPLTISALVAIANLRNQVP